MIKDIRNYANKCHTCKVAKYDRNPPVLKFDSTPTASKPLEHIHFDTFQICNQTVLDSFSGLGKAYAIKLNSICSFGLPHKITTEREKEFKSNSL